MAALQVWRRPSIRDLYRAPWRSEACTVSASGPLTTRVAGESLIHFCFHITAESLITTLGCSWALEFYLGSYGERNLTLAVGPCVLWYLFAPCYPLPSDRYVLGESESNLGKGLADTC